MSQPYKSGRQQNLNLGITSVTENRTVLQTIGKVGIGTTNAQNHSLFVVGTTNITGDINVGGASTFVGVGTFRDSLYVQNQLYVGGVSITGGASIGEDITTRNILASGISTFNGLIDANAGLDVVNGTTLDNLNVTGIATIQNLNVQSGFDVYDTQAVFHNNVLIAGNLSIGGTTTVIQTQDLRVFDKDIIIGVATDAFGNDISNDITANHGGIAVASTEGSPLVPFNVVGFNTLPDTYKQIMWVKGDTYGIGTTDAWLFNYAVGVGSTLVPNGVRFAVKGIQFTDDTISAPNLNLSNNLNVVGITTLASNGGITTTGGDLYVGGDLYISDDLVLDELTARNINITGITTVGVVSATSVNATGIVTGSSFRPSSGYYQSANGTNAFFVYNGTGNVAFQGTIGVGQINSGQGYQAINISSDTKPTVTFIDNGIFNGVVTARQFVGDITAGVATITNANITNLSGTNLNYTGIGTIDGVTISSGIITSSNPGVTTVVYYGDGSNLIGVNAFNVINQDITSSPVFPTFANSTGVTSIGIAPFEVGYVPASGNLGIGSTNPTAKLQVIGDAIFTGVVTARKFVGDIEATGTSSVINVTNLNVTGIGTIDGVTIASGIVTSSQPGVTTIKYYGDGSNLIGVNAFNVISQDLTSSPVYLTLANSTGVTSIGIVSSYLAYVPNPGNLGIGTSAPTQTLDVYGSARIRERIYDVNNNPGTSLFVLTSGGPSGSWSWQPITGVGGGTLNGIIVQEEGSTVGTAGSITTLDFRGNNITVAALPAPSGIATITVSDTPTFTSLTVTPGTSTLGHINATSATFSGNVSIGGTLTYEDVTNIDSIGIITARSDVRVGGNLSVVGLTTLASAGGITTTGGDVYVGQDLYVKRNILADVGITTVGGVRISSGIITSSNPGVTTVVYYGDGSNLIGVNAFNVINQDITASPVYPTFAANTGVSSIGISTSNLVYIPDPGYLGIGTTNPQDTLQVGAAITMYGATGIVSATKFYGDGSGLLGVNAFNVVQQDLTSSPVYPTFANNIGVTSVGIASTGFVYVPTNGSVGIGTTQPAYKLDVVGDINSSTAIRVGGNNILDEAVRLAIAFG